MLPAWGISNMINIIIYSKDRPMQLDLCLRSLKRFFHIPYRAVVLFTASNNGYVEGYNLLQDKRIATSFGWMKETNFRDDVKRLLAMDDFDYYLGIADDTVLVRDISEDHLWQQFVVNQNILTYTLRISKSLKYMFEGDEEAEKPQFIDNTTLWYWRAARDKDWRYPMSSVCNIFKLNDFIPYVVQFPWSNPNTLEGYMATSPINKPLMLCRDEQSLFELCFNRTQTVCSNRCGEVSAEMLNGYWLDGKQFDLDYYLSLPTNTLRWTTMNKASMERREDDPTV